MKHFAILIAMLAASAPSVSTVRARVWLVKESPVRVSGTGFAAGEHVTVTVTAGKARVERADRALA